MKAKISYAMRLVSSSEREDAVAALVAAQFHSEPQR